MSVRHPSSSLTAPRCRRGFLYAFFRFSQLEHASFIQYLVRFATASDIIHVAVVPVLDHCVREPDGNTAYNIVVEDKAFTAFMGIGFDVQPVSTVLTPPYELMLVPTPEHADFDAGMAFLHGLRGAAYNYRALPLTVLPSMLKRLICSVSSLWSRQPHDDDEDEDANKMASYNLIARHTPHAAREAHQNAIFCSQMGLLVCYVSHVLPHDTMDPSACAPGDLARILRARCALACDPTCISTIVTTAPKRWACGAAAERNNNNNNTKIYWRHLFMRVGLTSVERRVRWLVTAAFGQLHHVALLPVSRQHRLNHRRLASRGHEQRLRLAVG